MSLVDDVPVGLIPFEDLARVVIKGMLAVRDIDFVVRFEEFRREIPMAGVRDDSHHFLHVGSRTSYLDCTLDVRATGNPAENTFDLGE